MAIKVIIIIISTAVLLRNKTTQGEFEDFIPPQEGAFEDFGQFVYVTTFHLHRGCICDSATLTIGIAMLGREMSGFWEGDIEALSINGVYWSLRGVLNGETAL